MLIDCIAEYFPRQLSLGKSVLDGKFQEAKSDYSGKLIVTPEMVAKKIKSMKENKSPGVDGIPLKLLMETVEQISIPLARVFNLSLKANIIPLFKKGSKNYRITDQ